RKPVSTLRWRGPSGRDHALRRDHALIRIEMEAQPGRPDERDFVAPSLPGSRLGKRRHQFVIGPGFLQGTRAILQWAGGEDDSLTGDRELALPALAPQFE